MAKRTKKAKVVEPTDVKNVFDTLVKEQQQVLEQTVNAMPDEMWKMFFSSSKEDMIANNIPSVIINKGKA